MNEDTNAASWPSWTSWTAVHINTEDGRAMFDRCYLAWHALHSSLQILRTEEYIEEKTFQAMAKNLAHLKPELSDKLENSTEEE